MLSLIHTPLLHAQPTNHSNDELEEIVIKAHPLHANGLSQSVEVLRDQELADAMAANIGETLASQPGIRSANFGAASGRPVIRGLGGPRVKTTEDGIDSLDVSVTSTDHAVTLEPFIAKQISVLKGASTLLFGSGAIGGVVDVETGRIPTELNKETLSGRAEVRTSDNGNGQVGVIRLDGNAGESLAWHFDAFNKQADDYEIPGFVESAAQRAAEEEEEHGHDDEDEHEEEHDHEEGEEEFGVLEGSRFDLKGAAGGLSWVGDFGHVGASISTSEGVYGLVGGHGHEEEGEEDAEEEEGVGVIDFEQTRFDFSSQLNTSWSTIESLSLRFGINDYQHSEIEGSGEVGSRFDNEAWEAHLNAKHAAVLDFTGVLGLQLGDRQFSAVGEEAFVPPAETDTMGLYWVGEREFDSLSLELGARAERVKSQIIGSTTENRVSTKSASVGILVPTSDNNSLKFRADYSERAPSIEELFSNGPHLATQSFEIGNVDLDIETGRQFSVSWAHETDLIDVHATLYHNDFSNFIYQVNTGQVEDDLPVFVYQQNDADFTGIDFEIALHLTNIAQVDLDLRATFDTVGASVENSENSNLPRIPASRWSTELVWQSDHWRAKLSYADVSSRTDTAALELPTQGYTDLSAKLEYQFEVSDANVSVFLHGKNLTDEEQRSHTSFVKDFAPAPGRTIEAGVRISF